MSKYCLRISIIFILPFLIQCGSLFDPSGGRGDLHFLVTEFFDRPIDVALKELTGLEIPLEIRLLNYEPGQPFEGMVKFRPFGWLKISESTIGGNWGDNFRTKIDRSLDSGKKIQSSYDEAHFVSIEMDVTSMTGKLIMRGVAVVTGAYKFSAQLKNFIDER